MRKPFRSGRWALGLDGDSLQPWRLTWDGVSPMYASDEDLLHINRLTAKALKYRHRGKGAK